MKTLSAFVSFFLFIVPAISYADEVSCIVKSELEEKKITEHPRGEEKKLIYNKKTAAQLSDLMKPQIEQITQISQQFQKIQSALSNVRRDIFEQNQILQNEESGFLKKRKARKNLEELEKKAAIIVLQRNNLVNDLQIRTAVSEYLNSKFIAAREAKFQEGINVEDLTKIERNPKLKNDIDINYSSKIDFKKLILTSVDGGKIKIVKVEENVYKSEKSSGAPLYFIANDSRTIVTELSVRDTGASAKVLLCK